MENNETKNPSPEEVLLPDAPPKPVESAPARRPRGFAAMAPDLVREISRKGGKAAHAAGTAHEFTSDEARAAGRKGGQATHAKRRQRSEAPPASPEK
jgi:general stress protein YciG